MGATNIVGRLACRTLELALTPDPIGERWGFANFVQITPSYRPPANRYIIRPTDTHQLRQALRFAPQIGVKKRHSVWRR